MNDDLRPHSADVSRMHAADKHADHALITPNFTVGEFDCRSGFAYPSAWLHTRLLPLCVALEAIRDTVGRPIVIRSGYRTDSYNKMVTGSSPRSQHVQGRAADIAILSCDRKERAEGLRAAAEFVRRMHPKLGVAGLGEYYARGFLHVDIRPRPIGDFRLRHWEG